MVFIAAKRDELAVKAFEHALVYDDDNPQITLVLADTLLRLHKADQAMLMVEKVIKRQPQGVESYELLAKVLTALGREKEITPRLEEAAHRDSKNVPLQYVLADRYREIGQVDKAEALYKSLLTSQPTPQTYRALAASLLKRKKAADLLRVICDAYNREITKQAIIPQLQAAAGRRFHGRGDARCGVARALGTAPRPAPDRLPGPFADRQRDSRRGQQ